MIDAKESYEGSPSISSLFAALVSAGGANGGETLLEKLRDRTELSRLCGQAKEDRADLAAAIARVDQVVPDEIDAEWLARAAEEALGKERAAAELFQPVIEGLKGLLGDHLEPEIKELVRESLLILKGWLTLYRDLHLRLAKLAAERRLIPRAILRARPVEGEVDHEALSREFIARFPKLRAALAK